MKKKNPFKETFGIAKGKLKKSTEKILEEIDKEENENYSKLKVTRNCK